MPYIKLLLLIFLFQDPCFAASSVGRIMPENILTEVDIISAITVFRQCQRDALNIGNLPRAAAWGRVIEIHQNKLLGLRDSDAVRLKALIDLQISRTMPPRKP